MHGAMQLEACSSSIALVGAARPRAAKVRRLPALEPHGGAAEVSLTRKLLPPAQALPTQFGASRIPQRAQHAR
jgi:hypothetical protein